jgi:hypothetical protein
MCGKHFCISALESGCATIGTLFLFLLVAVVLEAEALARDLSAALAVLDRVLPFAGSDLVLVLFDGVAADASHQRVPTRR